MGWANREFFWQISSVVKKEMGQIPQNAQGEKRNLGNQGSSWIGTAKGKMRTAREAEPLR